MKLMASLNASFFHPYVQNGAEYLQSDTQCARINYRPPQPHLTLQVKDSERGNGPFHANEIEYVSQYNCENRADLDWCLCRIEAPAESRFIHVFSLQSLIHAL